VPQQGDQHAHPWKFVGAKTYNRHLLRHENLLSLFLFGIRLKFLIAA
jgi:hypothetical protein